MGKVKIIFKNGLTNHEEKIIECKAWTKENNMLWFNKTSNEIVNMKMTDKVVGISIENVLYVEDLED
jgi:hypothetical protein